MRRVSGLLIATALMTALAHAGSAQEADACRDEVQRVSETFGFLRTEAGDSAAVAQEPGTRQGAELGDTQRREITDLLEQARSAGETGDGAGCLEALRTARVMLREAGFGSPLPGAATQAGSATGSIGDNRSAGSTATQGAAGGVASPGNGGAASGAVPSGAGAATTTMGSGEPAPGSVPETGQGTTGSRTGSTLGGSLGAGTGGTLGGGAATGGGVGGGSAGGSSSGGGSN